MHYKNTHKPNNFATKHTSLFIYLLMYLGLLIQEAQRMYIINIYVNKNLRKLKSLTQLLILDLLNP